MILDQCPYCNVRSVQTQHRFMEWLSVSRNDVFWYVQRCHNQSCQSLILVQKANNGDVEQIFPFVEYRLESSSPIPPSIRDDFKEASLCLGAGCFKASLVMSRRVLQRCLADQDCNQNKLVDAIDAALKNGVLRKAFHDLAHEIRQYGNLGAHPDDDQLHNANHENARQVLEFARLLIHDFYEIPANASALKQNRQITKFP